MGGNATAKKKNVDEKIRLSIFLSALQSYLHRYERKKIVSIKIGLLYKEKK